MAGPYRALKTREASGSLVRYVGYNSTWLIEEAFDLKPYQVLISQGLRQSADQSIYYEITARTSENTEPTRALTRAMLRRLLTDRFQLKVHEEKKEVPVYRLVSRSGGHRLNAARGTEPCSVHIGPAADKANYEYRFENCTIDRLVGVINQLGPDRSVLDGTELEESFDINMAVRPDFRSPDSDEQVGTSIHSALRDLGLSLSPGREKMVVVVVDAIGKPTEN
jgi:uncharacterized protein (TIGR03435 family)